MYELTSPSEVARCAFLAAAACPFLRKMLMACSTSPPPSTSASRHAVKPAPVRSRSSFTCCADTFGFPSGVAMVVLNSFFLKSVQNNQEQRIGQIHQKPAQSRSFVRGCYRNFASSDVELRLPSAPQPPRLHPQSHLPARLPRSRLPASRTLRRRWYRRNPRRLRQFHPRLSDRRSASARTIGVRQSRRRKFSK